MDACMLAKDDIYFLIFIREFYREVRPRIEQLLTNDYQRIWWKEKRVWDETIAEKTASKRILPRMVSNLVMIARLQYDCRDRNRISYITADQEESSNVRDC